MGLHLTCANCGEPFSRSASKLTPTQRRMSSHFCTWGCYCNANSKFDLDEFEPTFEGFSTWLSYDPATGVLQWKKSPSYKTPAGSIAGKPDRTGYLRIFIAGRPWLMHRLAWLLFTGSWPVELIDHINGVRDDNRIANLRVANSALNSHNIRRPKSKNPFLGVSFDQKNKKYRAQIMVNRKSICLGRFDTAEAARDAYIAAKREMHEGCTL